MAFEGLSDKLGNVFKKLRSHGKLTEADVKEAMREVRMALLEADVSYKVVKDFVAKVSARAVGRSVKQPDSGTAGCQDCKRRIVCPDGQQQCTHQFPVKAAVCDYVLRFAGFW